MKNYSIARNNKENEISLINFGIEKCSPNHSFGPAVRENFLFNYVISGKGIFQNKYDTYKVENGTGFFITPGELTFYKADKQNPWHYIWIGFNGSKAKDIIKTININAKNPLFTLTDSKNIISYVIDILDQYPKLSENSLKYNSLLYFFLSNIVSKNKVEYTHQTNYVAKAQNYIIANLHEKISVNDLAKNLGINRSYLSTLFKSQTGISIKDYIINYKIQKSIELIKTTDLSIGEIARSVGYMDPLLFSKIFKKNKGISPLKYKITNQQQI